MGAPAASPDAGSSSSSPKSMQALPQYGYGADLSFDKLVEHNRFLFRVYTPKAGGPHDDKSDTFFVGPKFHDEILPPDSEIDIFGSSSTSASSARCSYADIATHLDWTKRSSSPYISTSFSFAWAVWEAARRYQDGVKHDVHIAVLDGRALVGRAVTALELLRQGTPEERHRDHWKWYRFASEAQDVVVLGYVPKTAVLATIPLLSVLPNLPSYFLRPESPEDLDLTSPASKPTPFSRLAWDLYTKPSYKQFCQDMSERFLRLPDALRVRDTTAGAVRLALCLLRPWFHGQGLQADAADITDTVAQLALVVAQWPAQWWVRDRAELAGVVRALVHVVAEEVREARRAHALREVERLQGIVADLARMTHAYERTQDRAAEAAEAARVKDVEAREQMAREAEQRAVARERQAIEKLAALACATPPCCAPAPGADEGAAAAAEAPRAVAGALAPAASALMSGLLFGSFCMLSIISSQRWELANHLT